MNNQSSLNWLSLQIWIYFRWAVSVYKKLVAIVPGSTTLVVLSSLVAQISLLLAFFLPLKIVILIGSSGMPRYFPEYFTQFDRDWLAIVLSIAAAGFYIFYQITSRLIEIYSERGAILLLERSKKLTLFVDQESLSKQAYKRFSTSLSAILFSVLGMMVILILYPLLAGFITSLLLLFFFSITAVGSINTRSQVWLADKSSDVMEVLSAVVFLSSVGFIVSGFVRGSLDNIIVAIICLLLVRQVSQRISMMVNEAIVLSQQKPYIDALFFHGKKLVRPAGKHLKGFWSLLEKQKREEWSRHLLEEYSEDAIDNLETYWHQLNSRGVIGIDVLVRYKSAEGANRYFIKLFNSKQRSQAIHEATLLGESRVRGLPAPRLLTTVSIESYQALVFDPVFSCGLDEVQRRKAAHEVRIQSWSVEPPKSLVNRYQRSSPIIIERLDNHTLYILYNVANSSTERDLVRRFEMKLEAIEEILFGLPLYIYNPNINPKTIRNNRTADHIAINWTSWSLEPIGAGWTTLQTRITGELERWLNRVSLIDKRMTSIPSSHVQLSALIFALEHQCNRENHSAAIAMLPDILDCIESVESHDEQHVLGEGARG